MTSFLDNIEKNQDKFKFWIHLKILWKIEHLLQKSKCSIFHNIFKYMIFQRHQKVLLWGKGLTWPIIISYNHNQIFYLRAGAGASSASVGPFPGNWLAARIADLTPDLQVLLSWGSTVVSFHSRQSFSVSFFHVCLGLPAPACRQSAYHILFWLHHSNAPHAQTSKAFSLSKWGRGPQAKALPVARLTLPWPHPLAWYCRSVWSWPYHCVASAAGSSW